MKSIKPTTCLFVAIIAIVVLHYAAPIEKIIAGPWNSLGLVPILFGMGLSLNVDELFRKNKTEVDSAQKATSLILEGPFLRSRNPKYLGFGSILLGIAILFGSLSPYFVVLLFMIFIDLVFIRHEEKTLEEIFGQDWIQYKARVRKWF